MGETETTQCVFALVFYPDMAGGMHVITGIRFHDFRYSLAFGHDAKCGVPSGFRGMAFLNFVETQKIIELTHKMYFADLWNRIHGDDAWGKNPFVWVIKFRRVKP